MWRRNKKYVTTLFTIILLILGLKIPSSAEVINNQSSQCADLLMLFARGSSSNPNALNIEVPFSEDFQNGVADPENPGQRIGAEEIPGAFFRWMEKRITANYPHIDYKAISVHYDPTKGYSQHGYPAVGIFNPDTIGNALQARFSWWKAGEYNNSVSSGSQELAGHIRDNVINCPNQRLVVGGYSQGAHVVHEALKITNQSERNLIDNVVLFGDPKFISSDGNPWNPFDVHAVYPWVRGTVALKEHGLGGAENPYVPSDMWYKTISWCHEDDFVCTGLSGLSWAASREYQPGNALPIILNYNSVFGEGHTRYPVFGVPEATAEVVNNLHAHFSALESSRGGLTPEATPYETSYDAGLVNTRPIDVMLALNFTDGNQDAQAQYFLNLKDITKTYKKNFTNLNTGGMVYSDLAGDSSNPNRSYVAGLMRPMNQLSSDMDNAFKGNVIYPTMPGGGDYPENHGMAIERGSMFAGWREDARKRFVIFAERPAHEQYRFNICESATINSLPHQGIYPCLAGSQFQTSTIPEWCASIREVLAQDVCAYHGPSSSTKLISRSLADAIVLANVKGITIDVIQPHTTRDNQPGYSPDYVEDQLKMLAESTGGLYLKYDVFDEPAMRDALWKILNHEPKLLSISQHNKGSLLNFSQDRSYPSPLGVLLPITLDQPTTLYASPISGAMRYGWDIDGDGLPDRYTSAPVLEHTFSELPLTVTVIAYSDLGTTQKLSTRIILTEVGNDELFDYDGFSDMSQPVYKAERTVGEPTVKVQWTPPTSQGEDIVVITDGQSGALLETIPASIGETEFDFSGDTLIIQYVSGGTETEPLAVEVVDLEPLIIEEEFTSINPIDDVGQSQDKTVTQDEPNNTETGASDRITPQPVTIVQDNPSPAAGNSPSTTIVASAQDVQTNPQNEVGGTEEVKGLFTDEALGFNEEPQPQESSNSPIIFGLAGVLVLCLLAGLFILTTKKSADDT